MANIVIIGGGAAGCFCAAELSKLHPDWKITVLEANTRPMAKLSITGGGRCNLTNTFRNVQSLEKIYPRGFRLMKRLLHKFSQTDCMNWFEDLGVRLIEQEDQCVFPRSQDAMEVVHALERAMHEGGAHVKCGCKVSSIDSDLTVTFTQNKSCSTIKPDAVILTSGGATADLLSRTDISIEQAVPSLFTLKLEDEEIKKLMGTVVQKAVLSLQGTRFRSEGTLLITDWGVSGPATLCLSSYAARYLCENGYHGTLSINWLSVNEDEAKELLDQLGKSSSRTIGNSHPQVLTERLWKQLLNRAGVRDDLRWKELGSKGYSRLINTLINDCYTIIGRARFKEEFVTCGGVSLSEINPETMECKKIPGLYLAGEVLDIDAVTGGFNLQAAWSTAWTAAHSII